MPVILLTLGLACVIFHPLPPFHFFSLPFGKVVRMDQAAMDKLIPPDDKEAVLEVLYEVRLCVVR